MYGKQLIISTASTRPVATSAAVELIRKARTVRRSGGPKCLIVPSKIDRRTDAGRVREQQIPLQQFELLKDDGSQVRNIRSRFARHAAEQNATG